MIPQMPPPWVLLAADVVDVAILLVKEGRKRAGHALFVAADATWAACIVVNNLARLTAVAVAGCGCDGAHAGFCVGMTVGGMTIIGPGPRPCKCSCHGAPPASAQ